MPEKKRLALFGSTGSIGRQTLEVVEALGNYEISLLSAHSNWELLAAQALRWKPVRATITDPNAYNSLKEALASTSIEVVAGEGACASAASELDYDLALNGLVGLSGLRPSYEVINRGKDLALANKESLVLGGDLLNSLRATTGSTILPVDSEHSAIFQCLWGERIEDVQRLILTASGGPFLNWDADRIARVTPEQALKHPNWKMGAKVTIDSATLMNKGLEVIEAYQLFGLDRDHIQVRIHPVSIVHSLVQFRDGSFKAQLGKPDMRLPIQVALTYPGREKMAFLSEDEPADWPSLEFMPVDFNKFPCLRLAYEALEMGGTATALLNGADEAAVTRFLNGEIEFLDIARIIESALADFQPSPATTLDLVMEADAIGRNTAAAFIPPKKLKGNILKTG